MPPTGQILLLFASLAVLAAQPVRAQDTATAEEAIANQRAAYGPPNPRKKTCGVPDTNGEIVVCAPDSDQYRVQSSSELDPTGHRATSGGVPRAPDLEPHYSGVTAASGCFLPPCPPPPVYYIDVTALPEAPAGSEAEEVARGARSER